MNSKILAISIIIGSIIVISSIIVAQEQTQTERKIQVFEEKINEEDWNNEVTRILPRKGELSKEWVLIWSDSTEKFVQSESPIVVRKTIAGNEVISTSYSYSHNEYGTYLILIWKGELVSNWIPKEAVESIFLQTDAKTERILEGLDLIPNCVVGYYDMYGEEKEIKNDLLFSECAKKDFRIRINLVDGEYNQESIEKIVYFSNLVTGKI